MRTDFIQHLAKGKEYQRINDHDLDAWGKIFETVAGLESNSEFFDEHDEDHQGNMSQTWKYIKASYAKLLQMKLRVHNRFTSASAKKSRKCSAGVVRPQRGSED